MPPLQREHGFSRHPKFQDFSIIVSLNFHIFPKPSQRPFWAGPSADLCPKVQFCSHVWIPGGPKIDPRNDFFTQRVDSWSHCFRLGASIELTRARFGAENDQATYFYDFYIFMFFFFAGFWINFAEILAQLSTIFIRFFMICWPTLGRDLRTTSL